MLDEFRHSFDIRKLPDDVEFENTNYIIGMTVFLIELIKTKDADDTDFERFELENFLSEKNKNLDTAFSLLFDELYKDSFTLSIKILDEYILHLKLSTIFERLVSELET